MVLLPHTIISEIVSRVMSKTSLIPLSPEEAAKIAQKKEAKYIFLMLPFALELKSKILNKSVKKEVKKKGSKIP